MRLSLISLFGLVTSVAATGLTSPCSINAGASARAARFGDQRSNSVQYKPAFLQRVDLTAIKSVKTSAGATLASCAVSCSTQQVANPGSCNVYYVENGICRAGVLDNVFNFTKKAGSSMDLVSVNIVLRTNAGNLGSLVKPVFASSSSPEAFGYPFSILWDRSSSQYFWIKPTNAFEYIQFDFGGCNLTFAQIIIQGEPLATDPLLYPSRFGKLEVRIGDVGLVDRGLTRSTNPLCFQQVAIPATKPSWLIFKCKKPLPGRYVTIQHFSLVESIAICEALFYAL